AGYVAGTLPGQFNTGGFDNFVRKYDTSGAEQWTRQFGSPAGDTVLGAAVDPTGGYVVGSVDAGLPGQTQVGGTDAFVRKYGLDGSDRWTTEFGSNLSDGASAGNADSSGVYITGFTQGTLQGQASAGGQDVFVAKLSPGGPPYVPFNGVVNGASYTRSVAAGGI